MISGTIGGGGIWIDGERIGFAAKEIRFVRIRRQAIGVVAYVAEPWVALAAWPSFQKLPKVVMERVFRW